MQTSYPEMANSYITIHPVRLRADTPHADQAFSLNGPARNFNFVGSRQKLSQATLRNRTTQPARHSVAFVAILHDGDDESPIGYSQYSSDVGADTQNLQVSVSTAHVGSDLAHSLARQLLDFAQNQGMRNVYARERKTDVAMQELARKLEMQQALAPTSRRAATQSSSTQSASSLTERDQQEKQLVDEVLIYTLGL